MALTGLPVRETLAVAIVSGNPPKVAVLPLCPLLLFIRSASSIVLVLPDSSSSLCERPRQTGKYGQINRNKGICESAPTYLSRICCATSDVTVAGLGIGASETAASSAALRFAPRPEDSLYKHSRLYLYVG
jgi:hypothetical protein